MTDIERIAKLTTDGFKITKEELSRAKTKIKDHEERITQLEARITKLETDKTMAVIDSLLGLDNDQRKTVAKLAGIELDESGTKKPGST